MSSLAEHLERYFDNLPLTEDCTEIVQLLTLDDDELHVRFRNSIDLCNRYRYTGQEIMVTIGDEELKGYEEPDSSSDSEEEIFHNLKPNSGVTEEQEHSVDQEDKKLKRKKDSEAGHFSPNLETNYNEGQTSTGTSRRRTSGIPGIDKNPNPSNAILNIDCVNNLEERKVLIDRWATEISLIVQSNIRDFELGKTVLLLAEHKTEGIVKNSIKRNIWNLELTGDQMLQRVVDFFYLIFLGLDFAGNREAEIIKEQNKARLRLTKMQICDICSLKEFTCEYEKNLYKLPQKEYSDWVIKFLEKLPIVGEKSLEEFNKRKVQNTGVSLGFAYRIVEEQISLICDLSKRQKQLKKFSKSCCSKIIDEVNTFGCSPTPKKYFKKKYKAKYKKIWKKKKKPFKSGKYFKKRDPIRDTKDKTKFCPKGKKNCRCWVCNEEGHYANECPNKARFPHKVKLIQEALEEGYEPIEDPYQDLERVFSLNITEDSSEEESSEEE